MCRRWPASILPGRDILRRIRFERLQRLLRIEVIQSPSVLLFPDGKCSWKLNFHYGVGLQVFFLVFVMKIHLEKSLRESDQLVFDPGTDGILYGICDRDNELIVAIELDEDRKDFEPVI